MRSFVSKWTYVRILTLTLVLSLGHLPSLLSQPSTAVFPQRRIALTLLNLSTDPNYGLDWMRTMHRAGCNTVIIPVIWETIYKNKNSAANWSLIDNQMKLASELGMKVGIRIHLGRFNGAIDGFWKKSESQTDFKGQELTHGYNHTHPSFVSEEGFESARKFITEICQRYLPFQQRGEVLFVNVSYTPDQEAGYYYQNRQWPQESYFTTYDHSDVAMADMRKRLEQKYKTVTTLNAYWGTKYVEFKKVDPPSNWWNLQSNFNGKAGKDWYTVRHQQLKDYMARLDGVVRGIDRSYKMCYDVGSFTDRQSLLRNTFAVKSLTENADFVKHNDEEMDWSFDIVRNNISNKPLFNEIYHFHNYTIDDLVKVMNWYFEEGSSMVCIIVANDDRDVNMARQAVERIVKMGWYDRPIEPIQSQVKMDLYLSQLIDNYEDRFSRWNQLTDGRKKRVQINLIEDIFQEEKIDYLPYKTPEQLAIEYGYYFPPSSGNGDGTPPPPKPDPADTTNQKPYSQRRFTPKPIIVKQPFQFFFENNVFVDNDGYISTIEMLEGPKWLTFRRDGFFFQGTPPSVGKYTIKLRAYDNKGASAEDTFVLEVIPPEINFQLIKADYFDIPITYYGPITEGKKIPVEDFSEVVNVLAECNVDSIRMKFDLIGPYFHQNLDDRKLFSLFKEGSGFSPPVGDYQLTATALKGDSLVATRTINFTIENRRDAPVMSDWVSYPNPFDDVTNLKIPTSETATNLTFKLVDAAGKQYRIGSDALIVRPTSVYINLRKLGLTGGVYYVEVYKGDELLRRNRVVKL